LRSSSELDFVNPSTAVPTPVRYSPIPETLAVQ
jgi:hypothetical protein